MSRAVVFLDRDGTLNVDTGYVCRWEQWLPAPDTVACLQELKSSGYLLAVVTNQAAVASGICSREDVERLHQRLQDELAASGAKLDAIAYCPHGASERCGCRKPATGMAHMVESRLGKIDYAGSWMIGDKLSDLGFGLGIGARTVLLRSRYWDAADPAASRADAVASSLAEATKLICQGL